MGPEKKQLYHCFAITLEHFEKHRKAISSRLGELENTFRVPPRG